MLACAHIAKCFFYLVQQLKSLVQRSELDAEAKGKSKSLADRETGIQAREGVVLLL